MWSNMEVFNVRSFSWRHRILGGNNGAKDSEMSYFFETSVSLFVSQQRVTWRDSICIPDRPAILVTERTRSELPAWREQISIRKRVQRQGSPHHSKPSGKCMCSQVLTLKIHTFCSYVSCGSYKKQLLLSYKALTQCSCVFCGVRTKSLCILYICFSFQVFKAFFF